MAVEIVSADYLNVLLAMKKRDLDTDGMNAALSLESNMQWITGTRLLTPEFLHDYIVQMLSCGCVKDIFPTALLCLL